MLPHGSPGGGGRSKLKFFRTNPLFPAHFYKKPLFPGVFQLEMARLGAEWLLGRPLSVREICKAKFLRPIIPAERICMNLKLSEETDAVGVRASFSIGGQTAGETVLKLGKTNDF